METSPATREFVGGERGGRESSSSMSSIVLVGGTGSENEEKQSQAMDDENLTSLGQQSEDVLLAPDDEKPKVEGLVDSHSVVDLGDMVMWPRLTDIEDGHASSATQLWISSNNNNSQVKRRRVNSEPTSLSLATAGLTRPVILDQLPDLVGVVRDSTWGSAGDEPAVEDPPISPPQLFIQGVPTLWGFDEGSSSSAQLATMHSFESDDASSIKYNDEVLDSIFRSILEKIDNDNDVIEDLVETRNDQDAINATFSKEIRRLWVRISY